MTVGELILQLRIAAIEKDNFHMPVMVYVYRDGEMVPEEIKADGITILPGKGILLE